MGDEGRRVLKAAVSGSFHRHMSAITAAVHELAALSVRVLSPADPRVVAAQGEFLFVASDRLRSVKPVQDRHLDSVDAADFLWLVCPDGYVGVSASMEIGAAVRGAVPIFAAHPPIDLTLREYVTVVPAISDALARVQTTSRRRRPEGILIDPHASIEEAHDILERIKAALTREHNSAETLRHAYRDAANLRTRLRAPILMQ